MKNSKIYIKLTKRDGTGPSIKKNLSSLSGIGQNLFKKLRKNSRINLIKNKMCKKIFKSIKEELTFYNKGMFNPYQIKADKLNIYLKQKTFKKTQVCFIFPVMSKNFILRSKKETISLYVSKSQFFDLVNQERIGRGSYTLFILKYLCRTNAKGWYALSCKGMKRGMKDYPTKKLIENYVKMECEYKEAQIPLFATWKFKDSNNQSEYAFILVNDPNLARGLIQISGCISLKKIRYCTLL